MDFLIEERFRSVEELAERARDWQLDFVQLEGGDGRFDLVQAGVGGVQIARARFSRRLRQLGASPRGLRTFAISMVAGVSHCWRGREVDGNDLLIFPENGELDSVSVPGFDNLVFSLRAEALEQMAEEEGFPEAGRLLAGRESVRIAPASMAALRDHVLACLTALQSDSRLVAEPSFRDATERDLSRELLKTLGQALLAGSVPSPQRRRSACLKVAFDLIDARGDEAITVNEICREAKCSERTLQYAFRDAVGIGPKAYLQAWRLNRVRSELSVEGGAAPVVEVANRYGFWHMGQFAADYRKMFGELPSVTRQRVENTEE